MSCNCTQYMIFLAPNFLLTWSISPISLKRFLESLPNVSQNESIVTCNDHVFKCMIDNNVTQEEFSLNLLPFNTTLVMMNGVSDSNCKPQRSTSLFLIVMWHYLSPTLMFYRSLFFIIPYDDGTNSNSKYIVRQNTFNILIFQLGYMEEKHCSPR